MRKGHTDGEEDPKKGKRPGFFFYSGDWMRCPELRRCSKGAIGCWADMLALLDQNVVRGVFCNAGGSPWPDVEIARAIGGDIPENLQFIDELIRKQVVSRNNKEAIYSRRMVRDTQEREQDAARKRKQRREERKRNNEENSTVTSSKETKCVRSNVTPFVRGLSEEEREKEEVLVFDSSSSPPQVELKIQVETFDFEAFVEKVREIYIPRGRDAQAAQMACCEAVEYEVGKHKQFGWHRSEAAGYILDRTQIAADLMRAQPKHQHQYWPTLYTFMQDHRYNDEYTVWEKSDGSKTTNGDADGALERLRARRASVATIQGVAGKVPEFQDW